MSSFFVITVSDLIGFGLIGIIALAFLLLLTAHYVGRWWKALKRRLSGDAS
jgi:hypothetical protein